MPADYRHEHDARTKTEHLATFGLVSGVASIWLFPPFVCMLLTRFAVVPLPEFLTRIGFLALAIGFCLVPGFAITAIVAGGIALRRSGADVVPQSARRAQAGMALGILILPVYALAVIFFFLAIFVFQVEIV